MNIKQAQRLSGVSADNIRFYEKRGLIQPARNPGNGYREYNEEDLQRLKLIRALRMLDMPLEQIGAVLSGKLPLSQAAQTQKERLEAQSRQLTQAIRLCGEFAAAPCVEGVDVDKVLAQAAGPSQEGFFRDWVYDYRRTALAEHEKRFTFLPDGAVTTPQEFSAALRQYAAEHDLELVVTKESMYPEFTIDGIEYTAQRNYTAIHGCPVASIACEAVHPSALEPAGLSPARRRVQRLFHFLWFPALAVLFLLLTRWKQIGDLLASWEGWVLLVSLLAMVGAMSFRGWLLFYNENGKDGRK